MTTCSDMFALCLVVVIAVSFYAFCSHCFDKFHQIMLCSLISLMDLILVSSYSFSSNFTTC